MSSKLRIGIIGAGCAGATACKACLEEGYDVVVYEKTGHTGGLWRYHEDDVDGVASVAKSTIINTSKEMQSYSDYPPPADFPNYMHNTKMVKYFDGYNQTFGFNRYVRFRHDVLKVEPNDDYESTGRWKITARDNNKNNDGNGDGQESTEVFDGVMVCTGHHVRPLVPTFRDQHLFKGRISHTHSYKTSEGYTDKRVVVVGIGNSGGDAAVEVATVAAQTYLSTRRGTWVVYRVGPNGKPVDTVVSRRINNFLLNLLPYNMKCNLMENKLNKVVDHNDYQLKPKHRVLAQHIMINDTLPNRILSGTVIVKGDIERFTETGIIFEGDTEETPCDAVVLATGYHVSFPFISQELIPTDGNRIELYKYAFAPKLSHPKTLAFIGLIQPIGAIMPIAELQCRWFALLMANKVRLPSRQSMLANIDQRLRDMRHRYYDSSRHTIQVDWLDFMDDLAEQVGCKPKLWTYLFTDPTLWRALVFGPCAPYQYRLNGPHSWPGARQALLTIDERIEAPLQTRYGKVAKKQIASGLGLSTGMFAISFIVGILLFLFYSQIV
ncbi:flavin-containing monooxygenase 5-like [Oppia nitens]|uniref:flavin-containing monooxygenase 5-like n=1 Tax=Oppia nitens TaxID=1686743 RepID=UPI0023DAE2B9|nr:flavin-containing monooxygenase 5-like [Oppia nitens]